MKENLKEEIINLLEEKCSIQVFDENDLLEEDLGMDSLDRVEFAIYLEKKFNISITDEETTRFDRMSVCDVVDFVESKLSR